MIVCEIGLNHLGDRRYADAYVDAVLQSGAEALTVQVREPEFYRQKKYAQYVLKDDDYSAILEKVHRAGRIFGVAICDEDRINFFESINTDFYKALYKDINNWTLTDRLMETKKPVYFSTGAASPDDITRLIARYSGGLDNLRLIHTQMSNDIEDVNLKRLRNLTQKFHVPVAYGNHCRDLTVLYLALAFEPTDMFIYVKGERSTAHPDEAHAVPLDRLEALFNQLKVLALAIGDGIKSNTTLRIEGMR